MKQLEVITLTPFFKLHSLFQSTSLTIHQYTYLVCFFFSFLSINLSTNLPLYLHICLFKPLYLIHLNSLTLSFSHFIRQFLPYYFFKSPEDTHTHTHTHIHTHTHTQIDLTDTQTDTQTHKQTDTETGRHRDRQIYKQTSSQSISLSVCQSTNLPHLTLVHRCLGRTLTRCWQNKRGQEEFEWWQDQRCTEYQQTDNRRGS